MNGVVVSRNVRVSTTHFIEVLGSIPGSCPSFVFALPPNQTLWVRYAKWLHEPLGAGQLAQMER
jgi:hypothetical protein